MMNKRELTIKFLKDLFRPRTIREIIAKEIKEAHLRKLEAESATEYARSLAQYNEQRVIRLQKRLTEHTEEGDYT
jgi:hypothetical protein